MGLVSAAPILARVSPLFVNCWFGFHDFRCFVWASCACRYVCVGILAPRICLAISFRTVLRIIYEGCGLAVSPGETAGPILRGAAMRRTL